MKRSQASTLTPISASFFWEATLQVAHQSQGALKCFSLTNATVLKQFPLTNGEQSYINMDIKNQLLITGSYDFKFLSVQRIPSDQGTFQQYRKLKNPVGSQDVIGFDVSFSTNLVLVVCAEAGLLFHYESFQFKGFCDTLFLQHPQTSRSPQKRRSSYIFPHKHESSPCSFARTHISALEYEVRQGAFMGEYAVVALVAAHRINQNDCFTILYSLTQQERGYVRYLPFLKIIHQSNPLFLANKKLNDGNNVTHLTFGLFEKVPINAPFADTMLGNTHLSKSSKSSGIESGLGDVLSVLAVAKLNGSLQLFDLSDQLKNYTAKKFKKPCDPFRVASESGSALFSRGSIFQSEPFINAEFNANDISIINQDYSSRSFMHEWPAHYQGRICLLKILQIQKQNLIITASEDGFMKMWSKEGRLLACSNVNQILPNIWDFRFNTKKKRLCTMYRAKLVYDSVVQKYSEIAGTKLKPSSKLKPLEFLHPVGEEKSEEERRRALLEHEEEEALILREAIQRYMQMKKVEEAKIHREQHDLDIKLMRQQLGLAGSTGSHRFEHYKAQDYIDSAAGGPRSSEGKQPARERNFLQNLEVMITRAKGMDVEDNPEVQRILNEYKDSRIEVAKFEKLNEKVKSMDVIKELGDSKRRTQSKWLAQNLLKVINKKWNRQQKEDFKNVLRVTTRKLYMKKQLDLKKRSKNSTQRTTSANIIRKIDDSKVSANKAELIKYAKAKNAAIGNQLSEACPVLPDGRPNSLYKYQVQEQIQASRNLEDSFDQEEKLPQPKIRDLLALMNSTVRKYKSCKNFNEQPGDNLPMLHLLNLTSTGTEPRNVDEGGIFTKLNQVNYPSQVNLSSTFITEQQVKEIPRREKTPQPVKRRIDFGLPKVSSLKDLSLKERQKPNFITHERRFQNYQKLRFARKMNRTPSSFSFKGQKGKGVFVSRNLHGASGALPSIFAEQKSRHPNASFAFEMAEAKNIKEEQITSNLL